MRQLFILLFLLGTSSLFGQLEKRANKEFELGQYAQAVNSYLKVIEKEPTNGAALARVAACYQLTNHLTEAADWYRKALNTAGSSPLARLELGHVLKGLGKYDEAFIEYEKYAQVQPSVGKHFSNSCLFAKKMIIAASPYVVKPEYLNTRESELNPTFFGELIFFNALPPRNLPEHAEMGYTNLVVSSLDQNNYLKIPTAFSDELHANVKIGPLTYDGVNNMVFYASNNYKPNARPVPAAGLSMSLYFANLNGDGSWENGIAFPFNGSGYSTGYPSLSPDGKTLYFASDRPDGYGGWDIYISRKIGNTWTSPENLGPILNTPGDEIYPFYDGQQLYFSSNWHPGLGGFDIFRANKDGADWNKIFHLGNQANSPKDDLGYVYSPELKIGYLTSNRSGGKGKMDIYRLQRQTDQIVITVSDPEGSPVQDAVVDFSNCGEASYRTNLSGQYSFQALLGFKCEAIIRKSGFADQPVSIVSQGTSGQYDIQVDLSREARKIPGKVVLASGSNPVGNVLIRATDQKTGEILETYTDGAGSYGLALKSNTTYVIRYSKVGYSDTHKKVSTIGAVDDNLLGVLPFEEVYASSTAGATEVNAATTSVSNSGPPPLGEFSIQLAATSNASAIKLEDFASLEGKGKVYIVEEKGLTKVRLGNFSSRADAEAALANCKREGYDQSFIIAQAISGSKPTDVIVEKPINPKPPVISKPAPSTPVTVSTASNTNNKYKIRLATYKNTSYFKPEKILAYGEIEKVKRGEMTIMLLAAFDNVAEAKQVLPKVKAAGFKTAHIVLDNDGSWKRISN